MNRTSRAGEAGFTLIELLVALVLVAFLTTLSDGFTKPNPLSP